MKPEETFTAIFLSLIFLVLGGLGAYGIFGDRQKVSPHWEPEIRCSPNGVEYIQYELMITPNLLPNGLPSPCKVNK